MQIRGGIIGDAEQIEVILTKYIAACLKAFRRSIQQIAVKEGTSNAEDHHQQ